jgi:Peptidoglycan-binding protein, CsiV
MIRALILATLVALAAAGSTAQDTAAAPEPGIYEVELLVFSNMATPPPGADNAGGTGVENASPALALDAGSGVAALRPELLRFGSLRAKLDRLPGHITLLHYGWTQELQSERAASAVALPSTAISPGLSGTVTAYRGRFLHVSLDLMLKAPEGTAAPARLTQSRRVKAGALQYFDNAQFGAIVVLRPAAVTTPTPPGQ